MMGKPTARCTCPQGWLYCMCKHVVKVISLSQSFSDAQIIQALGTRAGTSMQGLDKLHRNAAAQAEAQVDPLAELEDMLGLTCAEPEQEADSATVPAPASAPVPAPSHDSAACQQQVLTAVNRNRMWNMVADNGEMQQHLVSQLNRTEGALAGIQASHQNGTAHLMAILSRVQDTWGNSLVRKKVMGLDAGYPKSKRSKTAQQPSAVEAGQSAEPEAEPFSKPKPSRTKLGPRQQMKAAAQQENSSAAANAVPDARSKGACKAKVPNAPKFEKCGHHCTHPKLKKGCIWIKQQKALLVAESTTRC